MEQCCWQQRGFLHVMPTLSPQSDLLLPCLPAAVRGAVCRQRHEAAG